MNSRKEYRMDKMRCLPLWGLILVAAASPVGSSSSQAADLALPTPEQVAWSDLEIGLMIHFGPSTYEETQQDNCTVPLERINPTRLDTGQWAEAAERMGAGYIVLTAKHSGGFCIWPTKTTDYSVANTPWRDGQGDLVKEMADSCRKRGIRLGIYLSPADKKHGAPLTWGTDWKGGQGHCADPNQQPVYDDMYRRQLTELLSGYGEVFELWFDGDTVTDIGGVLEKLAPKAIVVGSRWANARTSREDGFAPDPNWNAHTPQGQRWYGVECPVPLRDTWFWFWNSRTDHTIKSLDHLMTLYYYTVGRNANLLLSVGPDRDGLIPEIEVRRLSEFGREVKRRFGRSVAETNGRGDTIELPLQGAPMRLDKAIVRQDGTAGDDRLLPVWQETPIVDHVVLMEDIAQGQRVLEYVVEGLVGKEWKELSRGTSIGHKKIDRFFPIMCGQVRLRCTKSLAEPVIRRFAVFNTAWNWWEAP